MVCLPGNIVTIFCEQEWYCSEFSDHISSTLQVYAGISIPLRVLHALVARGHLIFEGLYWIG